MTIVEGKESQIKDMKLCCSKPPKGVGRLIGRYYGDGSEARIGDIVIYTPNGQTQEQFFIAIKANGYQGLSHLLLSLIK